LVGGGGGGKGEAENPTFISYANWEAIASWVLRGKKIITAIKGKNGP